VVSLTRLIGVIIITDRRSAVHGCRLAATEPFLSPLLVSGTNNRRHVTSAHFQYEFPAVV